MLALKVPFLLPASEQIKISLLLSVPDAPDGMYHFAGIPDGLGLLKLNDRYFDLVVTHELFYNTGQARRHARSGAFVSRWRIDTEHWRDGDGQLYAVKGWDQIDTVHFWNHDRENYRSDKNVPFERFCSADLPAESALYYEDDDKQFGTKDRIFFGGEETHTKYKPVFGRAWGHVLTGPETGVSYELPRMGRLSFENVVCCPFPQKKTVAICLDDATETTGPDFRIRSPQSELYIYVGEKIVQDESTAETSPVSKAGLNNGELFGLKVQVDGDDVLWENQNLGFGSPEDGNAIMEADFQLHSLGDRSIDDCYDNPGTALQKQSIGQGIFQFLRLEDGAWDPRPGHQNKFYFVTTHTFEGNSRLFRLTFNDMGAPEEGGRIEILLNGKNEDSTYRFRMLDSITVDKWGRVLIQEDTGGKAYTTRTLLFIPETGKLCVIAVADEQIFRNESSPLYLSTNEESAGIIPAFEVLGEGWYLTAVQVDKPRKNWMDVVSATNYPDAEARQLEADLVAPGQLLALHIPEDVENKLESI